MALYLTRFSWPAETWAKLIENPEDRRGPVGELAEAVGGKLLGFWFAFGDGDGYALFEAPDNVSIAAALTTVAASGQVANVSTTVLVSVDEMIGGSRPRQVDRVSAAGRVATARRPGPPAGRAAASRQAMAGAASLGRLQLVAQCDGARW